VRGKAWASIEELEAILESEERPEGWQEGEAEGQQGGGLGAEGPMDVVAEADQTEASNVEMTEDVGAGESKGDGDQLPDVQ